MIKCKKMILLVVFLMFVGCNPIISKANDLNDVVTYYEYPITINSADWFEYSVLEKVEMLKIPQAVLEKMSDDAVVQAVLDYPYLVDIFAYNDIQEGYESFANYCSAFGELLKRDSAIQLLETYGESNARSLTSLDSFQVHALSDIQNYLLYSNARSLGFPSQIGSQTIYTPNGSAVQAIKFNEPDTASAHNVEDAKIVQTYGVTLVLPGSCKYNCHSYAWYAQSSANILWINSPAPYITDGSYVCVCTGGYSSPTNNFNISVNDRVVYYLNGNITHTALFKGNPASGAALATQLCYSKWGRLGVFAHTLSNVPANYGSTINIWHR